MASTVLFNSCVQPSQKQQSLLSLISLHPSFKQLVNQFYTILHHQPTQESLNHLGTLYFAFMLPDYPHKHLQKLAS